MRVRVGAWFAVVSWGAVVASGCAHAGKPAGDVAPAAAPTPAAADTSAAASSGGGDAGPLEAGAATAEAADAGSPAAAASPPQTISWESSSLSYPASALKDTFVKNTARLEGCFTPGLKKNPKLRGHVNVRFNIGADGRSKGVQSVDGTNLEDPAVIACVVKVVKALRFPKPQEGTVNITYPFIFHPYQPYLILPESASPATPAPSAPAPGQ